MAFDFRRPWVGAASSGAGAGRTGSDRLIYRSVMGRVLLTASAVIAAWWTVDLAARGRVGSAVVFGLWAVAGIAAMACLLWRPAVIVDGEAVELRNVVRDVRVPWAVLEDVQTRYALTLVAAGRRHQSWAGSAPGRPSATTRLFGTPGSGGMSGADPAAGRTDHRLPDPRWNPGDVTASTSSRDLRADSGAAAFMVEQGWRAWRDRHPGEGPSEETVTVRWSPVLPGVAVTAALLAAALTLLG